MELVAEEEDTLMVVEVAVMEGEEVPTRMDALDIMTSQEIITRGTTIMVEEEVVGGVVVATHTTAMVQPKVHPTLQVLAWLRDYSMNVLGGCFSEVDRWFECLLLFIIPSPLFGHRCSLNSPSNILFFVVLVLMDPMEAV